MCLVIAAAAAIGSKAENFCAFYNRSTYYNDAAAVLVVVRFVVLSRRPLPAMCASARARSRPNARVARANNTA